MPAPQILSLLMMPALMPFAGPASATERDAGLRPQPMSERVYVIIGPCGNRIPKNPCSDATFGFVVTAAGIVLGDTGSSCGSAAAIDAPIKRATDQPETPPDRA